MANILVIDDSLSAAQLMKKCLEDEGHYVDIAGNGEEGLKVLKVKSFDAALVDNVMPGMSGLEVIREIEKRDLDLPTVMVSGVGDISVVTEAIEHGAADYLFKDQSGGWVSLLPFTVKKALAVHDVRVREHEAMITMAKAKQSAEAATALKDRFVSMVAHDLRGPLGAMAGMLEFVMASEKDEANRERLRMVADQGKKLGKFVQEVLNLSLLQNGNIPLNKTFFDGREFVESVLWGLTPLADSKLVTLSNLVPEHTRLHGDKTLLGQALQNLVTNAIKFSHRESEVRIQVPLDHPASIEVVDEGVGIPERKLRLLFAGNCVRSSKGTNGEEGTGFGLSLCKSILEAHGGDIEVTSEEGKGSAFRLTLELLRPRVLVAEDDPPMAKLMAHLLDVEGADATIVTDGKDAWDILQGETSFDLLILDNRMPNMSGYELLMNMNWNGNSGNQPIIMMTSGSDDETKFLRMGASDFIRKPFDVGNMLTRMRRFIG